MNTDARYLNELRATSELIHKKREKYFTIIGTILTIFITALLVLLFYLVCLMHEQELQNDILISSLPINIAEGSHHPHCCQSCTNQNSEIRQKRNIDSDDNCDPENCAECIEKIKDVVANISIIKEKKKSTCDICYTKDCTTTAALKIHAMDSNVDPCQDFYQFTCGNFMRKHLVPLGSSSFTTLDLFYKDLDLQLKDLVEGIITSSKAKVVARIQEGYHACLNTINYPQKEIQALKKFSMDFFQWPLASGKQWVPKFDNLTDMALNLEMEGHSNLLFPFNVHQNRKDPTKFDAEVQRMNLATFGNHDYIRNLKSRHEKQFGHLLEFSLMAKLVSLFGNSDEESIVRDVLDMNELTNAIQNAQASKGRRKMLPGLYKIKKLYEITYDKIDWLALFNARLKRIDYMFKMEDKVFIKDPDDLKLIVGLLDNHSMRVISNSIGWLSIFKLPIFHGGPLLDKMLQQYEADGGFLHEPQITSKGGDRLKRQPPSLRWKYCVQILTMFYPLAMTRLYVDKYIDRSNKESADQLIQIIQESYKKTISDSMWLDEATKAAALRKADKIRRHVGYPDYIFDDDELDKDYAHMPDMKSTHFENVMAHKSVLTNIQFYNLPKRDDQWTITNPMETNANYMAQTNDIWFTAVTLQVPFFDNSRMAAVNFGFMGSIIGHEIGHAFDSNGKDYDENGKSNNWWTYNISNIYEDKSWCLIDQFSAFCPESLQAETPTCVSGRTTLAENIADNTGIQAAYQAYRMWVKENGKEKRLPGLEAYSPDQLFFISYAYFYCENISPANWLTKYGQDSHAPAKYRVLGTLSNSKEFREVFQCPEGPMNKGNKSCTIW